MDIINTIYEIIVNLLVYALLLLFITGLIMAILMIINRIRFELHTLGFKRINIDSYLKKVELKKGMIEIKKIPNPKKKS